MGSVLTGEEGQTTGQRGLAVPISPLPSISWGHSPMWESYTPPDTSPAFVQKFHAPDGNPPLQLWVGTDEIQPVAGMRGCGGQGQAEGPLTPLRTGGRSR